MSEFSEYVDETLNSIFKKGFVVEICNTPSRSAHYKKAYDDQIISLKNQTRKLYRNLYIAYVRSYLLKPFKHEVFNITKGLKILVD